MFPTVMGSELSKERVRDLQAQALGGGGPGGRRRRPWRAALGTALVWIGERLREEGAPRSELRPARIP